MASSVFLYSGCVQFRDENFELRHEGLGTLSMANAGRHTNGAQFFMCTGDAATLGRLDGKHVVFGKVIEGLEMLKAIEATGSPSGKPSQEVVVADCGVL